MSVRVDIYYDKFLKRKLSDFFVHPFIENLVGGGDIGKLILFVHE